VEVAPVQPEAMWRAAPYAAAALAAIVVGGLAAAVSRPLGWDRGPWTAAFLVLVTGVGQLTLGGAGAALRSRCSSRRTTVELVVWNAASALVIGGVATGRPVATTVGSVALACGTVSFATALRQPAAGPAWLRRCFATVLVVVAAGIPIGYRPRLDASLTHQGAPSVTPARLASAVVRLG
jgi:hypothetical protein